MPSSEENYHEKIIIIDISNERSLETVDYVESFVVSDTVNNLEKRLRVSKLSKDGRKDKLSDRPISITVWILVIMILLSILIFEIVLWGQTGIDVMPKMLIQFFAIVVLTTAISQIILKVFSKGMASLTSITNIVENYVYKKNTKISPSQENDSK